MSGQSMTDVSLPRFARPMGQLQNHRLGAAAVFMLLILMVSGPYLSTVFSPTAGAGNAFRQLCYILVFVTVLVSARVTEYPQRLLAVPLSLTVAVAWLWLSLSWAIEPDIAIRRLILTTLTVWTIFMAVQQVGYVKTIGIFRVVLVLGVAACYIAVLFFPVFGIHNHTEDGDLNIIGSWRGILLSKNFAGPFCAFTIIAFVFDTGRMRPLIRFSVGLITLYFLYRTNSKTSMGIMAIALSCGWLYTKYNPRYSFLLIPLAAMIIGCISLVVNIYWNEITAYFHRADAFTGRTQIWPVLIAYWQDNWLGSGYGCFWNTGPHSPAYQYAKGWVQTISSGHNGYLDLLASVGLPGLVLAVVGAMLWPLCRLLSATNVPPARGALLLANLIFCIGDNLTESSLLDRDMIVQVVLMFTVALIGVVTRPAPRRSFLR